MENENLKRLINQIIDQRINENISQADFAKRLGIKKSNLSRIESGKQNISADMLIRMINEFTNDFNLRTSSFNQDDKVYCLKLFDEILIKFEFERNEFNDYNIQIKYINDDLKHLFPYSLEPNPSSIYSFLKKRAIPKNRAYVNEILKSIGSSFDDIKGIIDVSLSLSLNDCYWVTKESFKGKFKDYNLFENNFSTALSLLAYTGYGSSHIVFTTSPELTTDGMLPKAWRRIDNNVFLFKGSTNGFANTGNEAFAEYYSSQLLEKMEIEHVKYDLTKWKGLLASVCQLFTSIDKSFVPASRLSNINVISDIVIYARSLGNQFEEKIRSMIIFDCLVFNEDRHASNFGYIYDSKTKQILDVAPIFDNGNSLFHFAMQKDIDSLDEYSKTRTNPYLKSFNEIAKTYISLKQKEQLKKLIGFKFKRHPKYNWSEHRLTKTEEFLQRRIKELLEM